MANGWEQSGQCRFMRAAGELAVHGTAKPVPAAKQYPPLPHLPPRSADHAGAAATKWSEFAQREGNPVPDAGTDFSSGPLHTVMHSFCG
jgi:hypothetical protein